LVTVPDTARVGGDQKFCRRQQVVWWTAERDAAAYILSSKIDVYVGLWNPD